jgi:FkbM family methyltransferase
MLNDIINRPEFEATPFARMFRDRPIGFVDVGARGGTHPLLEPIATITAVLGFEPDEQECARLMADPAVTRPWASLELMAKAVWSHACEIDLHLAAVPTNTSLLAPNPPFVERYGMAKFREIGVATITTTTLDAVLADTGFPAEFIKIDTQGSEYEILEGFRTALNGPCVAVVAEVWFCPVYRDAKLFSEIELLMREHGFSFYGWLSWHMRSQRQLNKRRERGRERALYADAVFFKDPLPGSAVSVDTDDRQKHVLCMTALLLGYHDFALELARSFAEPGDLPAIERLVRSCAALSPDATRREVQELAAQVAADPESANVAAGSFADRHRHYFDYDDMII